MYRFVELIVRQYMTHEVQTVSPEITLKELELLFEKYDFNAFPVVEGKKLVGIVTKFDFLEAFALTSRRLIPPYEQTMNQTVGEIMTEAVIHVAPATPATRALQLMVNLRARSFPVVTSDGDLVGMIAREDLMHALKEATQEE